MDKFWIVWDYIDEDVVTDLGDSTFDSKSAAQSVATKYAKMCGRSMFVLECIGKIEIVTPVVQVEWREL